MATYDITIARSKKRILDAWMAERGWANRLKSASRAFFEDASRNHKSTRLVMVDALGAGFRGYERTMLALNSYERVVVTGLSLAPDGMKPPPLAARMIVGGVSYAVFTQLCQDQKIEAQTLADELVDWIGIYRTTAGMRLSGMAYPPLRRAASPSPARFLDGDSPRARALGSVVHLVLDEGYGNITDSQIAQFAGISTVSFHKQFADKEECLLSALDEFLRELMVTAGTAMEQGDTWEEGIYRAVDAIVGHLVIHPGLVRLTFMNIFEIGPTTAKWYARTLEMITDRFSADAPSIPSGPALVPRAIIGGSWALVRSYNAAARLRYLPTLVDHMAFLILAPYIGPDAALGVVERR